MEGILLINKPSGITSHDVVNRVRRRFAMRRVGHAGTLDPLATGLLIILVGKATKLSVKFIDMDKAYRSTLILGRKTVSADIEGELIKESLYDHISDDDVRVGLEKYKGEIQQLPPMVSAVKHKGRKLYEFARKGITIERSPRSVRIDCLEIENIDRPYVQFYMECSKGTYVRQLADDLGDDLGCGACISAIQRTKIGDFKLEDAVNIEDLNENHLREWK